MIHIHKRIILIFHSYWMPVQIFWNKGHVIKILMLILSLSLLAFRRRGRDHVLISFSHHLSHTPFPCHRPMGVFAHDSEQ